MQSLADAAYESLLKEWRKTPTLPAEKHHAASWARVIARVREQHGSMRTDLAVRRWHEKHGF